MKDDRELTRRGALGLAAATAWALSSRREWVFAARRGRVVKTAAGARADAWQPILLTPAEGEALARLVDAILPRTDTPGARDARVHEYVDLAVSLEEPAEKREFVKGLRWLDRRCRKRYGSDLVSVSDEGLVELLSAISDEHEEHPRKLRRGARFFRDLKRRTVFGYYTSLEGRVHELGLPEAVTMQTWRGCPHAEGEHSAGSGEPSS